MCDTPTQPLPPNAYPWQAVLGLKVGCADPCTSEPPRLSTARVVCRLPRRRETAVVLAATRSTVVRSLNADLGADPLSPKDSVTALLESLRHRYRRSPYWSELWPSLESGIEELSLQGSLEGFSTASTEYLLRLARWDGSIVRDHLMASRQERTQRLVDLCAGVGATTYLCGRGGAKYIDESEFTSSGLDVRYYSYPSDATDRLSSLDYLFRNGLERFREVLSASSRLAETRP